MWRFACCVGCAAVCDMYDKIFIDIGKQINEAPIDTPIYKHNDENLVTAAEMFLYIMTPHQEYWLHLYNI